MALVFVAFQFEIAANRQFGFAAYFSYVSDCHYPGLALHWQSLLLAISVILAMAVGFATVRWSGAVTFLPALLIALPLVILGGYLLFEGVRMCKGNWEAWFFALGAIVSSGVGGRIAAKSRPNKSLERTREG
jgi:hypothetical protein